jgi:WhiB family redox-sensing transcriptional regulator
MSETRRGLEWQDAGICAQTDPEAFFPDTGQYRISRMARLICQQCIVIEDCLAHALAHPELEGVWGGTTKQQRQKMRRSQAS